MKLRLLACLAALSAALAAVSCATPYQEMSFIGAGGYVDYQVDSNSFLVRFQGNSYSDRDEVEVYLLYRCANIAVEQGADYFVIIDRNYDGESASALIRVCEGKPPTDECRAFDASDVIAHLRDGL
jgi:hypothetical protein